MKTLKFSLVINASKEKVWKTLWNDNTYRLWTSAFSEGSYAQTDWEEGSKVLFLSSNGDGMVSQIEKKIPNEEMVFKHLGVIDNGVEVTKDWGGAREKYYLKEHIGNTELHVELDTTDEFEQYFNETFPKALYLLKQISEQ